MGLTDFIKPILPTSSTSSLERELKDRETKTNVFPLWAFNPKVHPYVDALAKHYDIPRSFIGLTMLSAYSTAIGTSYVFSPNGDDKNYLPIWGVLNGMTSSGKTLVISKIFSQLYKIQDELDQQWSEKTGEDKPEDLAARDLKTLIFRDVHISTLVRYVMPDNPRGMIKIADEIMEWINGMNALSRKEGTDEQFWLSSWNSSPYSGIRSGKAKFVLHRPFVNVLGGIQPSITWKLFSKDRDTTGFVYRMLFAEAEYRKIAEPEWDYSMNAATAELHDYTIAKLYKELEVEDEYDPPKMVILTPSAIQFMRDWEREKIKWINSIKDDDEKEVHASIFGKIKEYAKRFVGILTVVDKCYAMDGRNEFEYFNNELPADTSVCQRAVELAEYFYQSAYNIYEDVKIRVTAPPEVLIAANLFNAGHSLERIASALKLPKTTVHRKLHKWIIEYPKQFKAVAK